MAKEIARTNDVDNESAGTPLVSVRPFSEQIIMVSHDLNITGACVHADVVDGEFYTRTASRWKLDMTK